MSLSVSIITPSYNQGRYIERTIQSVLTQDIPDLEYVIVDGKSEDQTIDILKRYETQLTWISEIDHGQAHAVNKGLNMTSGDIIGWLNSDDIYYPSCISRVVDFFLQHPEVDVVYGDACHINGNDELLACYPTEEWDIERIKKTCFLSQPAVFFRRRVLSRCGLLNEKLTYCMDYEYWLRLGLHGVRFAHLPHVLAGSRIYPETKTSRAPMDFSIETLTMLRDTLGYVPTEWVINNAMLNVKTTTSWRFPELRFNLLVLWNVISVSIRWNGLLRGLITVMTLPKTVIDLIAYKKKIEGLLITLD